MPARDVPLTGVFNVRDLGGLEAADGAVVRSGLLFRAAGLHRLAGPDVEAVAALGLRTVFDLRTSREIERSGGFPVDLVAVDRQEAPMMPRLWRDEGDAGTPAELLARRYAAMLQSGAPAVALVVERLAAPRALPAAFFCAAGKDRTGVLAGVLLAVLGVPDEDIAADYARSAANVRLMLDWLDVNEPDTGAWMRALPAALLDAPADAMRALLATLRERHGSARAYVRACGVPQARIDALAAALLDWR